MNVFDYINQLYNDFRLWLDAVVSDIMIVLYSLLDSFNPVNLVASALIWIVPLLPDPVNIESVTGPFFSGISSLAVYFQILDYFVNMPMFGFILAVILLVESGLLVVRMWRFIRSFIT